METPDVVGQLRPTSPKAELHLHLEGAVRLETVLTLARRNGVALPYDTLDGLRERFKSATSPTSSTYTAQSVAAW